MYTPDQEAVKIREQLWSERCSLRAWSLWPGVIVTLWPSIGHFSISDSGLKCQKDLPWAPDNDWECQHSSAPQRSDMGGERGGVQGFSASVSGCTLWAGRGSVYQGQSLASSWQHPRGGVAAGLVQCIRSGNARHHLVCRRAVIVWDVCLPQPPPDSHVEFLTPKVWKGNLAFPK